MRIAIDTNRYRDLCEGQPDAVDVVRGAERVYLPFVTLAELRAGFLCGTRARRNEAVLAGFLASPRVHVLFPDDGTTFQYARLFAQLRLQGTPIPVNDIWIAALALQHHLQLFSRDSHFDALPNVARC